MRLTTLAAIAILEFGCILRAASPLADADAASEPFQPPAPATSPAPFLRQPSPERMQARVSALQARPLFTPGRTPYHAEPPPPAESMRPPRLTGLIVMQGVRRAIFAASDGQKPSVVTEGGQLGPFTVTAIAANEVELTGPAGVYTLHPSSDAGVRSLFAFNDAILPLISPTRREAETESDQ